MQEGKKLHYFTSSNQTAKPERQTHLWESPGVPGPLASDYVPYSGADWMALSMSLRMGLKSVPLAAAASREALGRGRKSSRRTSGNGRPCTCSEQSCVSEVHTSK